MRIIKERIRHVADNRGLVFEPLPANALVNQRNAHVVISRPGAVRGNHFHLKGQETLVVCGPALVRIRDDQDTEDVTIPPDTIYRFIIPPGVAHAVKNTGLRDSLLVAFNTETHDPEAADLVQDILISP